MLLIVSYQHVHKVSVVDFKRIKAEYPVDDRAYLNNLKQYFVAIYYVGTSPAHIVEIFKIL